MSNSDNVDSNYGNLFMSLKRYQPAENSAGWEYKVIFSKDWLILISQ